MKASSAPPKHPESTPIRRWRRILWGLVAFQTLMTLVFVSLSSVSAWRNQLHHANDALTAYVDRAVPSVAELGACPPNAPGEPPRVTGPGWKAWLARAKDFPEVGPSGVDWAFWFPQEGTPDNGWRLASKGRLPDWKIVPRPAFLTGGDLGGRHLYQIEQNGNRRVVVWSEVTTVDGRHGYFMAAHGHPVGPAPLYVGPWLLPIAAVALWLASALATLLLYLRLRNQSMKTRPQLQRAGVLRRRAHSLVEAHPDIQFTLDGEGNLRYANRMVHPLLGVRPGSLLGKKFPGVFLTEGRPETRAQGDAILSRVRAVIQQPGRVVFPMECFHHLAGESRFFSVTLESFGSGLGRRQVFGSMSPIWSSNLLPCIEREHLTLVGGNSLIQSETLSHLACRNLVKYLSETETTTIRIALREILINAMEHGNLNIQFSEKTAALMEDRYFDLIRSRRQDPRYASRKVHLEVSLDGDFFSAVVRDEGDGFDHRGFLEKAARLSRSNLAHGRGITMALSAFDEVHYNDIGNRVELIKSMRHRMTHQERLHLAIRERVTEPDLNRTEERRRREAAMAVVVSKDWSTVSISTQRAASPSTQEDPLGLDLEFVAEGLAPEMVEVPIVRAGH